MRQTDEQPQTEKTLSDALLGLRLIDIIVLHYPHLELQVRVLESALLNETMLVDIVIDPATVWREMMLTPGIGEKARRELSKVVCHALKRVYPREWEASILQDEAAEEARMPGLTRQLGMVRKIWKTTEPIPRQSRKVMCFSTRRIRKGYE